MGFFSKAKAFLNIGGVSVELNVPEQVERYGGTFNGCVRLTTKSEQLVKSIEIELEEHFFEGYGDERVMKKHYLGSLKIDEAFTIKPGEERRIDFELPFVVQNTINDNLRAHGGIYGVIGTIG
jgi:sporulation-control protein spo0M